LERAGLPTALITPLYNLAEGVGASRIVEGKAVPYPVGDPSCSLEEEKRFRKQVVQEALEALKTQVENPTVFQTAAASWR
jgi:glycine reductase